MTSEKRIAAAVYVVLALVAVAVIAYNFGQSSVDTDWYFERGGETATETHCLDMYDMLTDVLGEDWRATNLDEFQPAVLSCDIWLDNYFK